MGELSEPAAQALVYVTMVIFMGIGLYAGRQTGNSKELFLAARQTQNALPLGLNFLATSIGTWILFSLPEIGTIAGLLGVIAYSLACVFPLIVFAWLGPIIRRHNPDGFSLVSYVLQRFGRPLHILYCLIIIVYMALFLVSEFTGIGSILSLLAGIEGPVPVIILALVTTIYTAYGGLRASIFTDSIQAALATVMIIIAVVAIGTSVRFDHETAVDSGLLDSTKLGWELMYIMPIAVTFANMYHQGFWQRTFSAKDDRTLLWSSVIGSLVTLPVLILIGVCGLIAVWAGTWTADQPGYQAFFTLFQVLPTWVLGLTVVMSVSLVCCSVDTLQCALTSSVAELFCNKLSLRWCRVIAVVINAPTLYLSLAQIDILQLFLVADLLASATILPVVLGLIRGSHRYFNGWEALCGCIGGLASVVVFGGFYYGDIVEGFKLLYLSNGLYVDDESVLGAFIVAPLSSMLVTALASGVRMAFVRFILKRDPLASPKSFNHAPATVSADIAYEDSGDDDNRSARAFSKRSPSTKSPVVNRKSLQGLGVHLLNDSGKPNRPVHPGHSWAESA
ncbi:hypothetical protein H4R34_000186 [Dimargaris verticillata]|uniref:Sodium:solute symporter family-domain-containing protein n=1 Tax=Dimargaris verticillata TaxID=2761393 RepID=A0A9W8EC54_9FUNG|nr:hypothetical protein H4R34_000186 [Dimargaris verticillata]